MLSSGRIDSVIQSLNARLPVAVSAAGGSLDLWQWLRFQPAIALDQVAVANPPGFSSGPMLQVGKAGVQVELFSLFSRNLRVPRVELVEPVLNIETGAKGATNLAAVLAALEAKDRAPGGAAGNAPDRGVEIDSVTLANGTFRYLGPGGAPRLTLREIELALSDFGAGRAARLTLGARLFGGKASRLEFQGQAGPARSGALPAEGALSVLLAPAEIPKAARDLYLGDLAAAPPPGAAVSFKAQMKGDAMKTLTGAGNLQFTRFALGHSAETRLPLEGAAPFRLTLRDVLENPVMEFSAANASLKLGEGTWKGTLSARYDGSRFSGASRGAVAGVRVEQLLRAFTTAKDSLFGLAEISQYQLQFAGGNAAELRNSLAGGGDLSLLEGKVALFDLLGSIEAKLRRALGGDAGQPGTTDFLKLTSRFEVANGQVTFPDLVLQNSSSNVTGQGYFNFGRELSFDLTADLAGALAARLGGKPDAGGTAHLRVPVKVRGSLDSPKVYPDVASMAKSAVTEKAVGLLDSFLKKRKSAEPPK
jgi:uncharacterized protein involved in outer membrane biogenesis